MRRVLPSLLLCVLLAACARPTAPHVATPAAPVRVLPQQPARAEVTVKVPVVTQTIEHCPTAAEIRRLRAARPKPLRSQAMPASPAERVARTSAQLGLYEARGAWADQVEEALARCDPS
ncbi:MAG TPA: hypothetical protein VF649_04700 [Sphingomonas sp.]|uniref:hypothetical protein n=1 Tax=Sphingomonas sp. TaxID=28214 RepID=UPI002EDAB78A